MYLWIFRGVLQNDISILEKFVLIDITILFVLLKINAKYVMHDRNIDLCIAPIWPVLPTMHYVLSGICGSE
jgi:hypothetical protein